MHVTGSISAVYLFDIAEVIDLAGVRGVLGAHGASAELSDKSAGPPRVRYQQAPVIADGVALGITPPADYQVRIKFFDYGVVSVVLHRRFSGTWREFVADGQTLLEHGALERAAAQACRDITARIASALTKPRAQLLTEDYLLFAVHAFDVPRTADDVVATLGGDIAQLPRGERVTLGRQEVEEVLRHRLSYFEDDLVVATWNTAFIYDREAAAHAAMDIIEYANSHLLEFRYHDDLLEHELSTIYRQVQEPSWSDRWFGRRHTKATRRLHALFIDVNELTDRMENAVKMVGDVYAARLFNLVGSRMGLAEWKRNVDEKLKTLDDIHRFAIEHTGMAQANLLELVIVLILVLELGLFFAGIMT